MHDVTATLTDSAQWIVQSSGYVMLGTSFIGLGLAVFQLAFLVAPIQILTRAALQLLLLCIGSELMTSKRAAGYSMQLLLSTCAILTATIGLVIGNFELTTVSWTLHLVGRMFIYLVLLLAGRAFSPMSMTECLTLSPQRIKVISGFVEPRFGFTETKKE